MSNKKYIRCPRCRHRFELKTHRYCQKCKNEYNKRWYAANRGKKTDYYQAHRADPRRRAKDLLKSAAIRSARLGVAMGLDAAWIEAKLRAGRCEVTGVEFDLACDRDNSDRMKYPWSPSLDRLDGSLGYTKDNVRVVCWMYNLAKNRWLDSDVVKMATALVRSAAIRR